MYMKVGVVEAHLKFRVRGSQNSIPKRIRKPIYDLAPVYLEVSSCIYTAGEDSTDEDSPFTT